MLIIFYFATASTLLFTVSGYFKNQSLPQNNDQDSSTCCPPFCSFETLKLFSDKLELCPHSQTSYFNYLDNKTHLMIATIFCCCFYLSFTKLIVTNKARSVCYQLTCWPHSLWVVISPFCFGFLVFLFCLPLIYVGTHICIQARRACWQKV